MHEHAILNRLTEIMSTMPEDCAQEVLDFAEFLQLRKMAVQPADTHDENDFFSMAGIWRGREIDAETIRRNAWPGRPK